MINLRHLLKTHRLFTFTHRHTLHPIRHFPYIHRHSLFCHRHSLNSPRHSLMMHRHFMLSHRHSLMLRRHSVFSRRHSLLLLRHSLISLRHSLMLRRHSLMLRRHSYTTPCLQPFAHIHPISLRLVFPTHVPPHSNFSHITFKTFPSISSAISRNNVFLLKKPTNETLSVCSMPPKPFGGL